MGADQKKYVVFNRSNPTDYLVGFFIRRNIMKNQNVLYQINKNDYEIIKRAVSGNAEAQMALKRATRFSSGKSKEVLTDAKMQELFGGLYKNIWYYDIEADKWNRHEYFKLTGGSYFFAENDMQQVKRIVQSQKEFENFEVLAPVVMSVSEKDYPGNGGIVQRVKYKSYSPYLVGTIVKRDRASGKIMRVPDKWVGVCEFADAYSLSQNGMRLMVEQILDKDYLLKALMSIHGKKK